MAPSSPENWWLEPPPRAVPSRVPSAATTHTSVFDAPPSTARTAGWADRPVCHLRLRLPVIPTMLRSMRGNESGRGRGWEHLYAGAGRQPVRPRGPAGGRRAGAARPGYRATGGGRRTGRADPAPPGLGGEAGDDRRPAPGHRRRRLRRHPTAGGWAGGPPHRRDTAHRLRLPGPGDDRSGRFGQGPAHRPAGARDRRGDRRIVAPPAPGWWTSPIRSAS